MRSLGPITCSFLPYFNAAFTSYGNGAPVWGKAHRQRSISFVARHTKRLCPEDTVRGADEETLTVLVGHVPNQDPVAAHVRFFEDGRYHWPLRRNHNTLQFTRAERVRAQFKITVIA